MRWLFDLHASTCRKYNLNFKQTSNTMDRYIVISEHTAEECRLAVKHFIQYHANFLTHFEWGCLDNDHHAYIILEAESHENALMSVPPLFRDKAKAIKLTYFKPKESIRDVHDKTE